MYPHAKLLLPPPPVSQIEENWPLLTVSKGFFEGAIAGGKASDLSAAIGLLEEEELGGGGGGGWGDDAELEIDESKGRDYSVSNVVCVFPLLAGDIVQRGTNGELEGLEGEEGEDAGWDIEADDLDLPPDLVISHTHIMLLIIFKNILDNYSTVLKLIYIV